ncbi:MAG: orotate phosphoribosyltransferase [Hyphomicrobiaceae bacterium]|nr:orotate phosphoribosyltransferase [Hyphomicrobiaceae bacterium]
MSEKTSVAREAAELLLQEKVVYTRTGGDPFFFSSGWASPVFIDIKRLISRPESRARLLDLALERIEADVGRTSFDQIAGCELAGVPFASMVADRLSVPLVVALKQAKGFGRFAQCEGDFESGARTLLIDDVTTDGRTKTTFKRALERAEADVVGIFVLFAYNIFPGHAETIALTTLGDVIAVAENIGALDETARSALEAYTEDAATWSRKHGGIGKT